MIAALNSRYLAAAQCRRIDALYRRRFRDNPELLAAWNSACNIPWKARLGKGGEAGERSAA